MCIRDRLMGVYDKTLTEPLAQVMARLGVRRGMVVYGQDKLDEISVCAPTSVCEIRDGWFQSYEITPEQFGYERCQKSELTGGTPEENAAITPVSYTHLDVYKRQSFHSPIIWTGAGS